MDPRGLGGAVTDADNGRWCRRVVGFEGVHHQVAAVGQHCAGDADRVVMVSLLSGAPAVQDRVTMQRFTWPIAIGMDAGQASPAQLS